MYGVNHIGDKTPWYSPHIVAGNLPLTPAISEYSLKQMATTDDRGKVFYDPTDRNKFIL